MQRGRGGQLARDAAPGGGAPGVHDAPVGVASLEAEGEVAVAVGVEDHPQSLKVALHQFGVSAPAEFDGAFAAMRAKQVGALVVLDDATLLANAPAVAALALKQRMPSCGWSDYAVDGGLMSYGVDFLHMFRRASTFVVKILQGAKPSDLPFERATKFETIVNLKTAKAIGIEVPTSVLLRADEVIE